MQKSIIISLHWSRGNNDFNTLHIASRYITLIFDQTTLLQNSFMLPFPNNNRYFISYTIPTIHTNKCYIVWATSFIVSVENLH